MSHVQLSDKHSLRERARQHLGDKDPTTRRIFEDILAQEEKHADDLAGLLDEMA